MAGNLAAPLPEPDPRQAKAAAGPQRKNVQALVFEFSTQVRFALSDVNAFEDLPGRHAKPAAKFHLKGCPTGHYRRFDYTARVGLRGGPCPATFAL
jgi:hypothetical protein